MWALHIFKSYTYNVVLFQHKHHNFNQKSDDDHSDVTEAPSPSCCFTTTLMFSPSIKLCGRLIMLKLQDPVFRRNPTVSQSQNTTKC